MHAKLSKPNPLGIDQALKFPGKAAPRTQQDKLADKVDVTPAKPVFTSKEMMGAANFLWRAQYADESSRSRLFLLRTGLAMMAKESGKPLDKEFRVRNTSILNKQPSTETEHRTAKYLKELSETHAFDHPSQHRETIGTVAMLERQFIRKLAKSKPGADINSERILHSLHQARIHLTARLDDALTMQAWLTSLPTKEAKLHVQKELLIGAAKYGSENIMRSLVASGTITPAKYPDTFVEAIRHAKDKTSLRDLLRWTSPNKGEFKTIRDKAQAAGVDPQKISKLEQVWVERQVGSGKQPAK
jgi:hypothetical protein